MTAPRPSPSAGRLDPTFLPPGVVAPPADPDVVRLAAFLDRSLVAGPGVRAVAWVAGCLRRCPVCIKPEFLPFDAGERVKAEELADRLLAVGGLDGVTFSGGEPFEQAAGLAAVARRVRAAGMTVLAYTGYRLEALRDEPRFHPLLAECDVLIDGEYRRELPGPFRWRGSANQRVLALSAAGAAALDAAGEPDGPSSRDSELREIQATVGDRSLRLTGFPSDAVLRELTTRLASRGVELREGDPT